MVSFISLCKRSAHFLFILTLAVSTLSVGGRSVSAQSAPGCSDDSSTIVIPHTGDEHLVVAPEGESWGVTTIGPIAIDVPAGTYTLPYVSFDEHAAKGDLGQDEERWFVEGHKDGVTVFSSSPTDDVPADSDYLYGMLDESVDVPELDSISFRHVLDHANADYQPQSVVPVCVGFTPEQSGGEVAGDVTCNESLGYELNSSGQCVCSGDLVDTSNPAAENASACHCPDGTVNDNSSESSHACTPCSDGTVANAAKDTCETAPDDTNEGTPSTDTSNPGVLGDSTSIDNQTAATGVLGASDTLADTGTDQTVQIAIGATLILLAIASLRSKSVIKLRR